MDQSWWSVRISESAGAVSAARSAGDRRSAFEHDRARILHSRAFRRLQHKTQVFSPRHRDFYRTRLTHSLECAQLGKALALNLWPEGGAAAVDLVEAACLAHDIGHPPFGHRGEAALNELTGAFEGNAQTIRVLVRLEQKKEGFGLDLTRATLASVIKYPFVHAQGRRKYLYDDDVAQFIGPHVFGGSPFGLYTAEVAAPRRPFPLQLMEWADDVAYSTHDLEDGINAGFITQVHLRDPYVVVQIVTETMTSLAKLGMVDTQAEIDALVGDLVSELGTWADPPAAEVKRLADARIDRLVRGVGRTASEYSDDWLYAFNLQVPRPVRVECEFLKTVAKVCVFRDSRVTRMEYKGERAVRDLYERLLADALAEKKQILTSSWRRAFRKGDEAAFPRLVCDYIAGMSDVFCLQLYAELTDPSVGTPFVTP